MRFARKRDVRTPTRYKLAGYLAVKVSSGCRPFCPNLKQNVCTLDPIHAQTCHPAELRSDNLYFSDSNIYHTDVILWLLVTTVSVFVLQIGGDPLKMVRAWDASLPAPATDDIPLHCQLSGLLCSLELLHLGSVTPLLHS